MALWIGSCQLPCVVAPQWATKAAAILAGIFFLARTSLPRPPQGDSPVAEGGQMPPRWHSFSGKPVPIVGQVSTRPRTSHGNNRPSRSRAGPAPIGGRGRLRFPALLKKNPWSWYSCTIAKRVARAAGPSAGSAGAFLVLDRCPFLRTVQACIVCPFERRQSFFDSRVRIPCYPKYLPACGYVNCSG